MSPTLEIFDCDAKGFLSFDLKEVLQVLTPKGKPLQWSILEIEAVGNPKDVIGYDMNELEEKINQSDIGLKLDWNTLLNFAERVDQVINCVIVGYKNSNQTVTLSMNNLEKVCEIVIKAIDSSLWSVYCADDELIRSLQLRFKSTKVVS